MALTKRNYVDGETIITAQNLNDIQDEVIAHESNKVPTSRTVNGKALSSNISLTAANVGAVPTTRTINSKALSSNITLNASNIPNDSSVTGTNVDDAIETLADGQVILASAISDKILYFNAQTVSAGSNTEILRITDSRINATTVVLEFQVVDPDNIKSSINWTSGAGYISFVGTCSAATTANVTLGNR